MKAVHGYFAHTPAEVALKAADQLRIKFGFSTHARDARKISAPELRIRAAKAACVVACNNDVASTIREAGARRVHLVPHGVDLKRFNSRPSSIHKQLQILAIGRLVEKKGFHFLIAAAARLKFPFSLRIVGEGPVVDASGDRDGLPNVLLEAMACGRPVIASDTGAISVALKKRGAGILLGSGDSVALAAGLTRLANDRPLRERLGQAARELVEGHYDLNRCGERFCQLLQDVYA